jgi:hypothetical protein
MDMLYSDDHRNINIREDRKMKSMILCVIACLFISCATTGKVIDWTLMGTTPYLGNFCEEIGENIDKALEDNDGRNNKETDSPNGESDNEEDTES